MDLITSIKLSVSHGLLQVKLESEISGVTLGINKILITDTATINAFNSATPGYAFTPSVNITYGDVSEVSTPGPRFIPVKRDPTITFSNMNKVVGQSFQLNPISDSPGAFTFKSSNPAVATVTSSTTLSVLGRGSAIITATQAATEEYNGKIETADILTT